MVTLFSGATLGGGGWRERQARPGMCIRWIGRGRGRGGVDDEGSWDMMKEQQQQWTRSEFFGGGESKRLEKHIPPHSSQWVPYFTISSLSFLRSLVCLCLLCGWGGALLGEKEETRFQCRCRCRRRLVLGGWLVFVCSECLEEGFDVGGKAMKKQSKSALWSMCSRKSNVMRDAGPLLSNAMLYSCGR